MTTEKAQVRTSVPTARIVTDERLIQMKVGETRELKATALPLLAKNTNHSSGDADSILSSLVTDKIQWSSNDAQTASVDANGKVSALKEGSCKVIVKSGELEVIFNILVEVAIPDWASEEFLAYIERIGAYTELPLGTDGSAGPSAQYVTFGFERQRDEYYHYTERGKIDTRTETTYKGYTYAKGADDDDWYWYYGWRCYDSSHDHSEYPMDPITDDWRGSTYIPEPYYALKIKPRKWRLLDKQKGLMVMENNDVGRYDYFSLFYKYYENSLHYEDHTKNEIEKQATLCDYETSYLRAMIDGGEYYEYIDLWKVKSYNVPNDSNSGVKEWELDNNGKMVLHSIDCQKFLMDTTNYYRGKYHSSPYSWNFDQYFTEKQYYSQIKEVDLDCGEGGSVKGRLFILSEDEIKQYYYNSNTPISDSNKYWLYSGMTFWTRTRKKVDGKYTLCGFKINSDGTVKEFVQFEGYDTGDYNYFISAICVPQQ